MNSCALCGEVASLFWRAASVILRVKTSHPEVFASISVLVSASSAFALRQASHRQSGERLSLVAVGLGHRHAAASRMQVQIAAQILVNCGRRGERADASCGSRPKRALTGTLPQERPSLTFILQFL